LTDQSAKFEVSQSQLTQRLDIFEEEIIKRVREIQKYSKGLNSLIRKNVMADLALTVDKVAKIE
jgi:biotin operon repressor|tara:strand:+ start:1831 stop:2022 length:192 start_codon:yes stop_codon:yes gene_type:complete